MGIPTVVLISMFFIVTVTGQSIVRLSCPAPVDPPNGKITKGCKNRPGVVGSTAEFQCNYGYDGKPGVKGSLTCVLDKTGLYWKANIDCPIRGCDVFNIPMNAKVLEPIEKSDVCPDDKVPFECEEGFYMKVRVRCQVGFVLGYTHTCEKEVEPVVKPPYPFCKKRRDVVFVFDGSDNVGSDYFKSIIKYVQDSILSWSVTSDWTHIGAVMYAEGHGGGKVPLMGDPERFQKELGNFNFPGGQTKIDKAFVNAKGMLDDGRSDRDVRKIIVVITGKLDDKEATKAGVGGIIGYHTFVIGIGNHTVYEWSYITQRKRMIYSIKDSKEFPFLLSQIVQSSCRLLNSNG